MIGRSYDGWFVYAHSVDSPDRWRAERQVVSRQPNLDSDDTKTLSDSVSRTEFEEFKKKVENVLKI